MISAWEIYWVMQLDSINSGFLFLCFTAFAVAIVLLITGAVDAQANPEEWGSREYKAAAERSLQRAPGEIQAGKRLCALAVFLALIVMLLPSTKTAAVMVVLPAVVNNETVQHEANELYSIAKDALRELAKPDPEPKAVKKVDET